MDQLIVVENRKTFPLDVPGAQIVTAREYLTSKRFVDMRRAKVFNLCRDHGYQALGYYVSLLAAARGHRPLPSLGTIQNLRHVAVIRTTSEELEALIERSLSRVGSDTYELSMYFGQNVAAKYDRLCQTLFSLFPAPLLKATFRRVPKEGWRLTDLSLLSMADVPEAHHYFLIDRTRHYFDKPRPKDPEMLRYDLAILTNPEESDAPSNERAIEKFVRAARQIGIRAFVIGKEDYARVAEYDALFIRETTGVNHHTFRFANRAAREGLVVIDDPESILRCCNKVYQAELFDKNGIPAPRTMVVHGGNRREVEATLGLPCVLKRPDSSFSQGVVKASTPAELKDYLERFLENSELVVAQAYVKSDFDWRVGVLDGRALYVCRYYMARGHWQIQKTTENGKRSFGRHETMAVEDAPQAVVGLAVRAANLIGHGLYGVDLKEVDGRLLVMEVNDNPSIEAGVEDTVLKDELYRRIMRVFYERLEQKGRHQTLGSVR
jgi:glutathione synthase/RimK-type ligase-like ATP-grasp enzyme